jgi:hypothetical protein
VKTKKENLGEIRIKIEINYQDKIDKKLDIFSV